MLRLGEQQAAAQGLPLRPKLHVVCFVQPQVPVLPRDTGTFHCSLPRLMPLTAIDPSLAIGFFCADSGAWQSQHGSGLGYGRYAGYCAGRKVLATVCFSRQLQSCSAVSMSHGVLAVMSAFSLA